MKDIVNKHEEMLDKIGNNFMTLLKFLNGMIAGYIEKDLAAALNIGGTPADEQDETIPTPLVPVNGGAAGAARRNSTSVRKR